ncbi:MAG: hypothetical protein Q9220_003826 [cf. Caloplaca sp. 1 TL-2023]
MAQKTLSEAAQFERDDFQFTVIYDRLMTRQAEIHRRVTALYARNRDLKISVSKSHPPETSPEDGDPSKESTIFDTSIPNRQAKPYSRLLDPVTMTADREYHEAAEKMDPQIKNNLRMLKAARYSIATLEMEETELEREAERLRRIRDGLPPEDPKVERMGFGLKRLGPAETAEERVARLFGHDGAGFRRRLPKSDYEIDSSVASSLVDAEGETDIDDEFMEREPIKRRERKRSKSVQELTREDWAELLATPKEKK